MKKMTMEQIKEEALLCGYDFEELIENLKENGIYKREYVYGYSLAEDKIKYLESMAENKVVHCDRIKLFKKELKEHLKKIESKPHTRIFSGYYILEGMYKEDGSTVDTSIFRIISINDRDQKAIVRHMEYVYDDHSDESIAVYFAELDYEQAIEVIETSGVDELIQTAEQIVGAFVPEETIYL